MQSLYHSLCLPLSTYVYLHWAKHNHFSGIASTSRHGDEHTAPSDPSSEPVNCSRGHSSHGTGCFWSSLQLYWSLSPAPNRSPGQYFMPPSAHLQLKIDEDSMQKNGSHRWSEIHRDKDSDRKKNTNKPFKHFEKVTTHCQKCDNMAVPNGQILDAEPALVAKVVVDDDIAIQRETQMLWPGTMTAASWSFCVVRVQHGSTLLEAITLITTIKQEHRVLFQNVQSFLRNLSSKA